MDHLQQARYSIKNAMTVNRREDAVLKAQMATAHALIALVERMDKMAEEREIEQERREILAGV